MSHQLVVATPCDGYRICLRDLPASDPVAGPVAIPSGGLVGEEISFPVLVPRDLTRTHGVDITEARIDEMVAAYDPVRIRAAALKLDHSFGGPAHGWADRIWKEGGALWAHWIWLSQEARDGLNGRQWPYRSFEAALAHEITGGWYLTGCALLGSGEPALPDLPPIVPILKLSQRFVLNPGAPAPTKEPLMSTKTQKPNAGAAPAKKGTEEPASASAAAAKPDEPLARVIATTEAALEPAPEAEEEPVVDAPVEVAAPARVAAAAGSAPAPDAAVQAEVTRLRGLGDRTEAATVELEARNSRAHARDLLDALGGRVSPAMRKSAEPLLTLLLSHQNRRATVQLSAAGGASEEVPMWKAFVDVLSKAPDFEALDAGELADDDQGTRLALDNRSAAQQAFDRKHGVSDERYVELQRKGLVGRAN